MLRVKRFLPCFLFGFWGRDSFTGCLEPPERSKWLDAVREPKEPGLFRGDIPKFHCAPSGKWRRQLMVLAEKSPAQTLPEPWLRGDWTSWGSTVSQLDLRRIRQAPKGKTTVHSSSLSATHKPRYGSVGPSQCIHVSQHNT